MNILFLTMSTNIRSISQSGIYNDLLRKFMENGHDVYSLFPNERRTGLGTILEEDDRWHSLGVKTLNIKKTNVVEKGIGQVLLEYQFMSALKKYLGHVKFDIVLYCTPPITFTKVIKWVKLHNPSAITYLILKDIFPQNAVDLGMLKKTGIKGYLYKSFRNKEKELYGISDFIGCMSPANIKYILSHNPEISPDKIEICPNSYDIPTNVDVDSAEKEDKRKEIRLKYHLPVDKPIFIYGGNMGKPQGIPFLIECLNANKNREDCHFLIVGDGYDYPLLESWYNNNKPKAVSLFKRLPKSDYDLLADACDIGLIFLDHRFTIPNYPSRLLPYLLTKKPIVACTDPNCDTGELAVKNGYGMYCESNDVSAFNCIVDAMLKSDLKVMGEKGYKFYLDNYTTEHSYSAIINHIQND